MVNMSRRIMLITAFLLAVFVFVGGFYAGFLFDSYRVDETSNLILNTQLDADSFITERDFFNTFSVKDCSVMNKRMSYVGERLGEIGNILTRYDTKKTSHVENYDQLKRKYLLLEINAYILKKQMFDSCRNISTTILFFYDTLDNQNSLNQGYAIDALVKRYSDITVFSIDSNFDDPAIKTVLIYYNITKAPSIVVNFENKYEGFVSEGELNAIVKGSSA